MLMSVIDWSWIDKAEPLVCVIGLIIVIFFVIALMGGKQK